MNKLRDKDSLPGNAKQGELNSICVSNRLIDQSERAKLLVLPHRDEGSNYREGRERQLFRVRLERGKRREY